MGPFRSVFQFESLVRVAVREESSLRRAYGLHRRSLWFPLAYYTLSDAPTSVRSRVFPSALALSCPIAPWPSIATRSAGCVLRSRRAAEVGFLAFRSLMVRSLRL